jgi:hypothetical protein
MQMQDRLNLSFLCNVYSLHYFYEMLLRKRISFQSSNTIKIADPIGEASC